jgi:hypothetical protein
LIRPVTPKKSFSTFLYLKRQPSLAMEPYLTILLGLVLAEFVRRCCFTLLHAFTGPLSKVPGPFLAKFTNIPWAIELIRGTHFTTVGPIFQKYDSDIIRVGKS